MVGDGREFQEGGDVCTPMADSCQCMAETNTIKKKKQKNSTENFWTVQWLRLQSSTAWGTGSIPGWGIKFPHATWHSQKTNKKTENKFYQRIGTACITNSCHLLLWPIFPGR